jgi:SAM-dependent methyltransferase
VGKRGPAFYDDDDVFGIYMQSRERPDNPNDTMEQPLLRDVAGDVLNQRILDLGCGAAAFGAYALAQGCRTYLGLDGSRHMVDAAQQTLAGTAGEIVHATVEDWDFPAGAFDLVVSSLLLHYVADLDDLLRHVRHALVPGGRLIFTVEHPVITSTDRGWSGGPRGSWLVDDYFLAGVRETTWLGARVIKYHRTIEAYVSALQRTGFVLDGLREAQPLPEHFADPAEYERRRRIPLFLLLSSHLSADPH